MVAAPCSDDFVKRKRTGQISFKMYDKITLFIPYPAALDKISVRTTPGFIDSTNPFFSPIFDAKALVKSTLYNLDLE